MSNPLNFLDFSDEKEDPKPTQKHVAKRDEPKPKHTATQVKNTQKLDKLENSSSGHRFDGETKRTARAAAKELNDREFRLFCILVNPEHWAKARGEVAELAGVSESFAYSAPKRVHFQDAFQSFVLSRLGSDLPRVMQAAIDTAIMPGKEGYGDRKMLMSMAGLQTDRRAVEHAHTGKIDIGERLEKAGNRRAADIRQISKSGAFDVMFDDGDGTSAAQPGMATLEPPTDRPVEDPDLEPGKHKVGIEGPTELDENGRQVADEIERARGRDGTTH